MLVIGSGNVVHNLGGVSRAMPDAGFDWAQRFDEQAKERMLDRPGRRRPARTGTATSTAPCRRRTTSCRCCTWRGWPGRPARRREVLVDGYAYGSLSMTAYTRRAWALRRRRGRGWRPPCPTDPPPDGANI